MFSISGFTKLFSQLSLRNSHHQVFNDFLSMVICALSGQRMEEEYLAIIKNYKEHEQKLFAQLFAEMVIIMDDNGNGFCDCLGEFFMNEITKGHNGQYFTPSHITDLMAQLTGGDTSEEEESKEVVINKTVCDPACGSGRTLLSFARHNSKNNWFFGADVDDTCAKMCVINLCLNSMKGQVAHMDSLALSLYKVYEVYFDETRFFMPTIRIMPIEESVFYHQKEAFLAAHTAKQEAIKRPQKKAAHTSQITLDLFSQSECEAV